MTNPFVALHRALGRLNDSLPSITAGRLESLILLTLFGIPIALIACAVCIIAPGSAVSVWLAGNWPWLVVAAVVAFSIYRFCRNVMDVRTGD